MIREKEYHVVVTACAPFKENETNPTQDVKLKLPDRIEREGRIPIRIIKYPTDFRNVLKDMNIIPELWNGEKSVYEPGSKQHQGIHIDAMLHLGMNFSDVWQVETRARRDGYDWVGDDGLPLPKYNGGEGGRWEGLPRVLEPYFNVEEITKRLHKELPNTPVMISRNAGLLYCEFIFYTSLSALYKKDETQRAMFLHHAGNKTESRDIEEGAKVAASVICSMVDQLEKSNKMLSQPGSILWR
ncbi:uncharacterized protein GGS22DRAFT_155178 [Annulohypoxylon maeteangense]|uniref:uncharacterized protein n=1 Tax=Annulohypoxylon maeteangense TaxID=1927788 RepID=UPI0020072198|nr:uncharacterized protein GGS22DRAFT_155178 [Annulohypoxylon maeteangense]KAI0888149.1 hypothetical protein GGS22DRAFT_155178 [Annulohypoxylon maeteangense]